MMGLGLSNCSKPWISVTYANSNGVPEHARSPGVAPRLPSLLERRHGDALLEVDVRAHHLWLDLDDVQHEQSRGGRLRLCRGRHHRRERREAEDSKTEPKRRGAERHTLTPSKRRAGTGEGVERRSAAGAAVERPSLPRPGGRRKAESSRWGIPTSSTSKHAVYGFVTVRYHWRRARPPRGRLEHHCQRFHSSPSHFRRNSTT